MQSDTWNQWTSAWRDLFDFDAELRFIVATALENAHLVSSDAAVVERARQWEQIVGALIDEAERSTAVDELSVRMLSDRRDAVRRTLGLCEFATA